MRENNDHSACVNAWMERAGRDGSALAPERLVQRFEAGFCALWHRAHLTLADVTLMAITDRVLVNTAERHPHFSVLEVDATGLLRCQELSESASGLPRAELEAGIAFVLVEFLTVLGNLTADILTPPLHAALSQADSPARVPPMKAAKPTAKATTKPTTKPTTKATATKTATKTATIPTGERRRSKTTPGETGKS